MHEAGVPGFVVEQWQGALVPSGTPSAIVARLQRDIARALQVPEVTTFFANDGARTIGSTPQQFRAKLELERATWTKVVKEAGIKTE